MRRSGISTKKLVRAVAMLIIVVLMLPVVLAACNDNKSSDPTEALTDLPTETPTQSPTESPTENNTQSPTENNTQSPTENNTQSPTESNTQSPTESNTQSPTENNTQSPTESNTQSPTDDNMQSPTEGNTQAPTEDNTQTPTEPVTDAPTEAPTEAVGENYEDVVISKVYGNGGKTDGAMSSSFIELYNTSSSIAKLGGTAIYYGEGASFAMLDMSSYEMAPKSYLLIKCKTVDGYDTSFEVLRIDEFDIEWEITIDNKEFEVVYAQKSAGITPSGDFENTDGVISYIVARETDNVNVYWVDNLSKHRMIVRTELTSESGYHRINLSNAGTFDLKDVTPRTSNGNVNTHISSNFYEVIFSQDGQVTGTKAFNVRLSAPEGWKIYYTLDGSDPRETGKEYTSALKLSQTNDVSWGSTINLGISRDPNVRPGVSKMFGGRVVKAYATNGTDSTAVYTQTYFMSNDLMGLDTKIISMSVPAEDLLGSGGAYFDFSLFETRPRTRVFIEVFDEDGKKQGGSYAEVAVSGNGSSGLPMKSLRVYYKDPTELNDPTLDSLEFDLFEGRAQNSLGQSITSFDRILLRNGGNDFGITMLRDVFCQRMATGLNVDRLEYEPVLVFINGEFWGMYNCRERYSPEYFNRHYGVLEKNVAIIENESPLKYDASLPESWNTDYVATTGDELVSHDVYAKEFNELVEFIRNSDMSLQTNYDYVSERLDIDTFIDYWVVNTYFCNPDWPGNNIKVWKNIDPNDPSGMDTRWRFLLLDMDSAIAYPQPGGAENTLAHWNKFNDIANNTRCGSIMHGLCQNEEFVLKFVSRAYELVNDNFSYKNTSQVLSKMVDDIEDVIPYQFERYSSHGSMAMWSYNVETMYSFLANRTEYYLEHLYDQFGLTEEDAANAGKYLRVTVSSNPIAVTVNVDGETVSQTDEKFKYQETDSVSISISIQANTGYIVDSVKFVGKSGEVQTFSDGQFILNTGESGTLEVKTSLEDPIKIVSVESAMLGVYAIDDEGNLWVWGANTGNALGIAGGGDISTPTHVMSGVKKVVSSKGMDTTADAANEFTTAILTTDGKLYTVGNNSNGQLGRSGATDSLGLVSFSGSIVDVALGRDHLIVLDSNGSLWGIGNNSYGQLGSTNAGGNVTSFVKIADNVGKISAGRRNTYYVDKSGNLYGLGDNRWYKITSSSSETKISTPTYMTNNVSNVFGSTHQVLILKNNGDLYYLGQREITTFIADNTYRGTMELVHTGVIHADIYYDHIVMLCEGGDVYGYGFNGSYQLGSDAGSPVLTATKIAEGAVDIAAGASITIIALEDGSVIVSGSNYRGQAGNGTTGGCVDMGTVEFPYIK